MSKLTFGTSSDIAVGLTCLKHHRTFALSALSIIAVESVDFLKEKAK